MSVDYSTISEPLRSICDGSRGFGPEKRSAFELLCKRAIMEAQANGMNESLNPEKQEPVRQAASAPAPLLGDAISSALSAVGITEERVSKWLGRPCGCGARKEKLNAIHRWFAGDRTTPLEMD